MSKAMQPVPEMVEGPFYAGGGPRRADIREGQPGQSLSLEITVVNAADGAPLAGVDVDLWHCNATGHYSGYDVDPDDIPENISNGQPRTNDDTFLRGKLATDDNGRVIFQTVYPSWYTLRTPHIHLKLIEGEVCNTTTQLFLPEGVTNRLLETSDYARGAEQDTFNRTDLVIGNTPADIDRLWVDIDSSGDDWIGRVTLPIVPGNENELIIVPPGRIPPKGGRPHDKPVQ